MDINLSIALKNALIKCGNTEYVDDNIFNNQIMCSLPEYLKENYIFSSLEFDVPSRNEDNFQHYSCAIATLFIECSKENNESSYISSYLEELKWLNTRIEILKNLYEVMKPSIRDKLTSYSTFPPQIVDVNWKMDYIQKDSTNVNTGNICYMVTLHIENGNEKRTQITFRCSIAQLTHFVTRLRQASRFVQKYALNS